jgi:hypothetical protein
MKMVTWKFLLLSGVISLTSCDMSKREETSEEPGSLEGFIPDTIAFSDRERKFKQAEKMPVHFYIPDEIEDEFVPVQPVIDKLPVEWTALTESKAGKIRLIPCKKNEPDKMYFRNMDTRYPELHLTQADELYSYFVVKADRYKRIYKLKLIRFYEQEGGISSNFQFLYLELEYYPESQNQEGIVRVIHGNKKLMFTDSKNALKYSLVRQLPGECK